MKRVSSLLVALVLFSYFTFASPIVITVLDNKDNTQYSAVRDTQNIWDTFEEEHPNIIIKRESFYSNSYRQRLNDYIEKGEMPDVFYAWPDTSSFNIHSKGLAKDLMPFMERDGLLDSYEPIFVDPTNMEGNYLSVLPLSMSVNGLLFCNKVFLDVYGFSPASTYEELKEQCDFFNNNGITPLIMSCQYDGDVAYNLLSLVLGRIAGPNWAKDIVNGKRKFTESPFITALEFIQQMFNDGVLNKDAFETADYTAFENFVGEGSPYILADHQFAQWFDPELYNNEELVNACVNAQMGMDIIPFPTLPNEKFIGSYPSSFKNGYAMSSAIESGSEKEEACWELIKWLSGSEVQQYLLDNENQYPSLKEGVSFENLPPLDILMADIPNKITTMTPIFSFEFSNNLNDAVSDGIKSMAYGNTTPEFIAEVLQDLIDTDGYYDKEDGIFDLTLYEDETTEEDEEEVDPNSFTVLKEIKSDIVSMTYSIRLENDGDYTVYIKDELDEDYIIIITSNVDDAFNIIYTIEQELEDSVYDNILTSITFSDAPVKSVIKLITKKADYGVKRWKQFSDTQEFYFQWDIRGEE